MKPEYTNMDRHSQVYFTFGYGGRGQYQKNEGGVAENKGGLKGVLKGKRRTRIQLGKEMREIKGGRTFAQNEKARAFLFRTYKKINN